MLVFYTHAVQCSLLAYISVVVHTVDMWKRFACALKILIYTSQPGRYMCSKVPQKPVYTQFDLNKLPPPTKISRETIQHLERISLVDFANEGGIKRLEEATAFADQLSVIDTTNVEPLLTVLEDRSLYLREDEVTEGNCRKDILANATVTEDEYFVSPPGNIPLSPRGQLLSESK